MTIDPELLAQLAHLAKRLDAIDGRYMAIEQSLSQSDFTAFATAMLTFRDEMRLHRTEMRTRLERMEVYIGSIDTQVGAILQHLIDKE